MLSFLKNKTSYSSVEDDGYDSELKLGGASQFHSRNIVIKTDPLSLLLIVILFLSSIFSSWILFFNVKHSPQQDIGSVGPARPPLFCTQAPTRREWRTLTVAEQHDYVRAVRCLATKPSTLGNNGTLYDDFPWVHKHTSSNSTFGIPAWGFISLTRDDSLTELGLLQLMLPLLSSLGIATTSICTRRH